MRRERILLLALVVGVTAGCSRKESATASNPATKAAAAGTAASTPAAVSGAVPPAPTPAIPADEPSLVSFSSGAIVVVKPAEYNDAWSGFRMLDERSNTGWATPQNVVTPQTTVIELAERTELSTLAFDTMSVDGAGRGAKDVTVEMSDTSPTQGFSKIADATLEDRRDDQRFPVSATVPGRWVRLTVKNNHGAKDYTELMEFRGFGRQLTHTPFPNVTGVYDSTYGKFHLKQEGTSITGCYEWTNNATITGGIEGRIMKITWTEPRQNGPAIMVFTSDRKQMFGLWWRSEYTSVAGQGWNGTRISDDPGKCPNWTTAESGAADQVAKELEEAGRSRVYGINFDSDSDRVKDESKPTLASIAAVLKAHPAWRVTVEGHTDSTAGAAHNQDLSERRAKSVVASLAASGVEASRLTAAGLGATKPVASNDDPIGRAQNRRVELTLTGK
jgi:outer membrane protein OmpA-like peptidoglycan-associated protein